MYVRDETEDKDCSTTWERGAGGGSDAKPGDGPVVCSFVSQIRTDREFDGDESMSDRTPLPRQDSLLALGRGVGFG